MECLSCKANVDGNFCGNCGQAITTKKFSLSHILEFGIINGAFMINKGLLFTTLELLKRPGHTIREYLKGKRINHFNPFSLLILFIAIAYFVNEFSEVKLADVMGETSEGFSISIDEFTSKYPRLLYVINIPLMSLCSFLLFRKSKVNFAENVILNTYLSSVSILLSIPFTLLTVFYLDTDILSTLFQFFGFITLFYSIWVYYQFFSEYNFKKGGLIFRSLITVIAFSIMQGGALAVIVAIKNLIT